jgi:hypothetical protein
MRLNAAPEPTTTEAERQAGTTEILRCAQNDSVGNENGRRDVDCPDLRIGVNGATASARRQSAVATTVDKARPCCGGRWNR